MVCTRPGIPWDVLVANLHWTPVSQNRNADIRLRSKPDQGRDIRSFIDGFARAVRAHAHTRRKAYPERYEPLEPDDVVLDDATAKKIAPVVCRWHRDVVARRASMLDTAGTLDTRVCHHSRDSRCRFVIPHRQRQLRPFLHFPQDLPDDYDTFLDYGVHEADFGAEVAKVLIHHGEMDAALSICAQPEVDPWDYWKTTENTVRPSSSPRPDRPCPLSLETVP